MKNFCQMVLLENFPTSDACALTRLAAWPSSPNFETSVAPWAPYLCINIAADLVEVHYAWFLVQLKVLTDLFSLDMLSVALEYAFFTSSSVMIPFTRTHLGIPFLEINPAPEFIIQIIKRPKKTGAQVSMLAPTSQGHQATGEHWWQCRCPRVWWVRGHPPRGRSRAICTLLAYGFESEEKRASSKTPGTEFIRVGFHEPL